MQRNQIAAAGFAALLFAGGAAVGALGHRYYAATVNASSDSAHHRYMQEMKDRLKLTPAQATQLEAILHETRAKSHAQMLKIKQEHDERVKAILTPEQIPAYEKLVAELQRSREQEHHDRNH